MNNSLKQEIEDVKNIRSSVNHIMELQNKMEKSQDVLATVVKSYTDRIEILENEIRDLKTQNNNFNEILNKFKLKDIQEIETNLDNYFCILKDYNYKNDIELRSDLNKYIDVENEMLSFFKENGFEGQDDLYDFIINSKNHKCIIKEEIINDFLKNNIFNQFNINNLEELYSFKDKKPDPIKIEVTKTPEYVKLYNEFKILKEEKQLNIEQIREKAQEEIIDVKKEELEKYISEINSLKKENENINSLKQLIEKNSKELADLKEENNKLKKIKLQQNRSSKKNKIEDNKEINELPFVNCPLITINNLSDYKIAWKRHVSTEIYKVIKDNKILWDKINKDENIDKKTLNEAIDYIILKRGMKNIDSNRNYIRNMINRSLYMYNVYNTDLKYVFFSLNEVIKLNEDKWKKWKIYLDNKILELQQNRSFEKIEEKNIKIDNKLDIKSIVSGYLKEDVIYDIVNNIKNTKLKNSINNKINMDNNISFSDIFKRIREMRNDHIIKNNLHINVLKDKEYQKLTFKNCMGVFNEKVDENQTFDKMLDIAIKTDITPDDDENDELLDYKEYKNKLINIKPDLKLDNDEIVLFEKYLEFVLKSYMYSKYNKELVPKECIIIKNELIKKFTN